MVAEGFFVGFSTPTRPVIEYNITVFYGWGMAEKVCIPGNPVNIDLHDTQIGDSCGKMGTHHAAEVAIKIVGRYVHLVSIGCCCYFH